jgi:hypothetical protein
MEKPTSKLSLIGIGIGAAALLLALVHFYAGPFSPQPTLEDTVADTAVAIRDATVAALKGEEREKASFAVDYDLDRLLQILISVLGGTAVILGVVGFAKKEATRAAIGAFVLGSFAIGFQFLGVALGAIIIVILVAAVLSQLGFG